MKLKFQLIATLVACSIVSAAQAGFIYEAKTTVEGDGVRGTQSSTIQAWVQGDSARIELREGDGMGFLEDGSYMITHDAGDSMIFVNTEEKTWSKFDLGSTMNMAAAAMEGLGSLMSMEFTDFHMEKIGESDGGEILGYDTRHLKFRSGYTMKMSVMGREMNQKVDMDQEIWSTDAIDASAFSAWMRPDKRLKGMFEGLDKVLEQQYSQIDGAPLRAIIETTMTDQRGKKNTTLNTTEVLNLSETDVDDSLFEIPADYEETSFVAAGNSDSENAEEEDPMSALKGLFKRKKD